MSRVADALEKAGMAVAFPGTNPTPVEKTLERAHQPVEKTPERAHQMVLAVDHTTPKPVEAPAAAAVAAPAPAAVRVSKPEVIPAAMAASVANERLVVCPNIDPVAAEQYRKLASTMHQLQSERRLRVILVTSAVPGEGKSVTAANLALTLSESFYRRVLLIDADLRRPSLHGIFGVPAGQGLSTMLKAQGEPVARLVGVSDRLSLLTAGKAEPDPLGVLSSERMKHLVEDATEAFDWIIIDSSPLALFPDPELLAMLTDGVLMVIRAGATPYAAVQRAIAKVAPERIIGAVLNQAEPGSFSETGYTYDDYSYYHADDETEPVAAAGSAGA
jgi:protein-tyrosine kinase